MCIRNTVKTQSEIYDHKFQIYFSCLKGYVGHVFYILKATEDANGQEGPAQQTQARAEDFQIVNCGAKNFRALALRTLGVALTVGEKGVALIVGENYPSARA